MRSKFMATLKEQHVCRCDEKREERDLKTLLQEIGQLKDFDAQVRNLGNSVNEGEMDEAMFQGMKRVANTIKGVWRHVGPEGAKFLKVLKTNKFPEFIEIYEHPANSDRTGQPHPMLELAYVDAMGIRASFGLFADQQHAKVFASKFLNLMQAYSEDRDRKPGKPPRP